ncbi:MAG: DNA polymerase III subunit chi [Pseudomonadota bacterium]
MAEVLFYHLTRATLETTLPGLLERSLAKGWWVVLRCGGAERLAALDSHLWTYDEAGFLPHGGPQSPFAERQPIYLTTGDEIPNRAEALFLVDGARATPEQMAGLTRTVLLFDGRDAAAVAQARHDWKAVTGAGLTAVYWAQTERGWSEKARSGANGPTA